MLLRIGALLVVTGLAFIGMAWLEPVGPLLVILGAGCCAVALEAALDITDWEQAAARELAAGPEPSDRSRAA